MNTSHVASCYVQAWSDAAKLLSAALETLQQSAADDEIRDGEVHEILARSYWASWTNLREICGANRKRLRGLWKADQASTDNISSGSGTGFFFEQLVASLVVPPIKRQVVGDLVLEFNRCSQRPDRKLPRDPDIYFRGPTGRQLVFEVKQSVKLPTYKNLREIRSRYEEHGIRYLVIGGHVCLACEALDQLREEKWAAFVDADDKGRTLVGLPTVDDHIRTAVHYLQGEICVPPQAAAAVARGSAPARAQRQDP